MLVGVPFWGITNTKVTPLRDFFEVRRELDKQGVEQMERNLQR